MNNVKIGNKTIGENFPTFIIAEAGSNHNRDINQAKKLIEVAAEAGAVKFQIFSAETLYSKKTAMPNYLNGKIEQGSVWHLLKI